MSVSLKVLVAEDEGLIAEMIKLMIEDMGHSVPFVVHNKKRALEVLSKESFDMAVLDINLEGGSEGIELARHLKEIHIPYMYLTSYSDKQTLGVAMQTVPGSYVIKPFTSEELYTGIQLTMLHKPPKADKPFTIKDGHKSQLIDPEHILYIKSDNVYVEIYTLEKKMVSRQTLSALLEQLPSDQFVRIHRSYAVNIKKIESISRNSIQIGRSILPISRLMREEVQKLLGGK